MLRRSSALIIGEFSEGAFMVIFLVWVGFAIAVGVLASNKDRSGIGWFLLAVLVSPLIAAIVLLIAGEGRAHRCPFCAEKIKKDARLCPHCRSDLSKPAIEIGADKRPDQSGSAWR